jgi:copper oxidase (laccase) domain-containing protein
MTDNLTDSQRRLLAVLLPAVKREMVEIGDEIKAEIDKLRQEQKERHEQGVHDAELDRLKQEVKRKALGLLGSIGLTADDLAAWMMRQDGKRK